MDMLNNSIKNKRIAKNTLYLYLRMILVMLVSLYTVRVILVNLGVEDYGIYNLIGGVVVLFSFITNSSGAAVQRYLNFSLGEDNIEQAKDIYSASVVIHLIVSLLIIFLSETIGLWFVNFYLVIPPERIFAANWVYQFSVFTMVFSVVKIPYHATVIAYENMSFYAVMSIFECFGKLLVAVLLMVWNKDKLIFYGFLIFLIGFLNFLIFKIYAMMKFKVCHFKIIKDKKLYKELISFSGWSLLSSIGSVCANQGLNMILNRFCGVVANAAMGIANQVNNAVYQLISNFQVAFEPQITKSYAANDREYLIGLIFKTSKFSFFLLWFFVLPLGLNAQTVLQVWLSEVPDYSIVFLRLILVFSLIDAIMGPLWMVSYAIGNIRNYQIVAFIFAFITLPLAYVMFKFGMPPFIIILLRILNNLGFSLWRLFYLRKRMEFPVFDFVKKILIPSLLLSLITLIISFISFHLTRRNVILQFFVSCCVTIIMNFIFLFFIGCDKGEKKFIVGILKKIIKK